MPVLSPVPRASGLLSAMVTPLGPDGRLDTAALGRYLPWLAARGVDGVFLAGTTGEGPLLSVLERRRLLEATLAVARPLGLRVVAHVGAATTRAARQLARHAAAAGADAVAAVTPWFYGLDAAALADHFAAVAEAAAGVPFFLYNIPQAARNRVTPELVAAVAQRVPNLAGLKDSQGEGAVLASLVAAGRAACPGGFAVFCGGDGLALEALEAGADGIVSGNASTVPEPFADLLHAFRAGDLAAARKAQARIDAVRQALRHGADIGLYKAALAARGVPVGPPRPPLPSRGVEEAAAALAAIGLG